MGMKWSTLWKSSLAFMYFLHMYVYIHELPLLKFIGLDQCPPLTFTGAEGPHPSLAHSPQSPPGAISILCRFTLLQRQTAPTHLAFDFSDCMDYSFSMFLLFIFIEVELPYTITISFKGIAVTFYSL